jgi:hypothetical protein
MNTANRLSAGLALASGLLLAAPAPALDFAVGARAGTTGFGADAITSITPWLNLRASAGAFNYTYSDTYDDVSYDAELDLKLAGLLLDFHPFRGAFRISAGIYANGNNIGLDGTPTQSVQIGGLPFTPAQVGNITGTVEFPSSAPYLGIGWGNAVSKQNRFGVNFELGVLFQGSADVELQSNGGTLSNNPILTSQLEAEEQSIENDLSDFELYPVISMGLTYSF